MVFEETITIECFLAVWPLPSMVFQWFLILLPSLSMVFVGFAPLVKRCDGFDGSLWSIVVCPQSWKSLTPSHAISPIFRIQKILFSSSFSRTFFKLPTVFYSKAATGTNLESGQGSALSVQVFIRFWLYAEFPLTHRNNPPLQFSTTTSPQTPPHLWINEHFIRRVGGTKPDFVPFLNSKVSTTSFTSIWAQGTEYIVWTLLS